MNVDGYDVLRCRQKAKSLDSMVGRKDDGVFGVEADG